MKKQITLALLIAVASSSAVVRAAQFINLDFESPILPLIPIDPIYGRVSISSAFPGWSLQVGSHAETLVMYNDQFLDSSGLSLFGPGFPQIEGNYAAWMRASYELFNVPNRADISLSQMGLVPAMANSVRFKARSFGSFGAPAEFNLMMSGQSVPLTPLQTTPNYTLFGGDVSQFAGMMSELRVTLLAGPGPTNQILFLDSISFSSEAVPEPSKVTFLLLGGGLLAWRWRRKSARA